MGELLTVKQIVAEMNNPAITECTIRRWCNDGLKHINGRPILIRRKWVEDFIEQEAERKTIQIVEFDSPKMKIKRELRKLPNPKMRRICLEDLV